MDAPLISVVVPVYKVEAYLDRCVQSIVDQTLTNLEIILVDDGSPDSCPAMCDAWAAKDSRIKVIHKENGGLSDARNAGLAVAEGTYISFVDSDDWVEPQFLEVLLRAALENDCQIAECDYAVTSGDSPKRAEAGETLLYTAEAAMELHLRDRLFRQVVWNKLYRREVITVPFETGKYHEDVFWTYQIIANCEKLAHVNAAMYCYFQRETSIMGQGYSLKRLDAVEAAARRCVLVTEKFPALAGIAQGEFIGSCMYHYQQLLKNQSIDPDGSHKTWVYRQLGQIGQKWRKEKKLTCKQRVWLNAFLRCPQVVCKLRNALKIGI